MTSAGKLVKAMILLCKFTRHTEEAHLYVCADVVLLHCIIALGKPF